MNVLQIVMTIFVIGISAIFYLKVRRVIKAKQAEVNESESRRNYISSYHK